MGTLVDAVGPPSDTMGARPGAMGAPSRAAGAPPGRARAGKERDRERDRDPDPERDRDPWPLLSVCSGDMSSTGGSLLIGPQLYRRCRESAENEEKDGVEDTAPIEWGRTRRPSAVALALALALALVLVLVLMLVPRSEPPKPPPPLTPKPALWLMLPSDRLTK